MNITIRMKQTVYPDLFYGIKPGTVLKSGRVYRATIGEKGAVCGICENGERLGVKPGEFEVIDAEKEGRT